MHMSVSPDASVLYINLLYYFPIHLEFDACRFNRASKFPRFSLTLYQVAMNRTHVHPNFELKTSLSIQCCIWWKIIPRRVMPWSSQVAISSFACPSELSKSVSRLNTLWSVVPAECVCHTSWNNDWLACYGSPTSSNLKLSFNNQWKICDAKKIFCPVHEPTWSRLERIMRSLPLCVVRSALSSFPVYSFHFPTLTWYSLGRKFVERENRWTLV